MNMFCECGCGQKTNIIKCNSKTRKLIKGNYRRFIHGHNPTPGMKYNQKWYKQCGKKSIREHRLLAENVLGKPLPPEVQVHHFDNKKFGNNIIICQDNKYHSLLHIRLKAYLATGDQNKRKCSQCKEYDDIENMEHRIYTYNYSKYNRYYHKSHRELKSLL